MKNFIKIFVVLEFVLSISSVIYTDIIYSQVTDQHWSVISEESIVIKGERRILPLKYSTVKSDFADLQTFIQNAPLEFSDRANNSPLIIELPSPSGELLKYFVTEYSMMEPGLTQIYPDIKTYNLKGVDDPFAFGKFDITMHGFHAMILTPRGDYFIDPYSTGENEIYICYYKKDYTSAQTYECLVNENKNEIQNLTDGTITSGSQLRTYRLAMAANGEYTTFHGGTVPAGMAAVVTAINRVNGLYERDIAVRMILVANNNQIIYTNGLTDPYTNEDGIAMLFQNQVNIDLVIGAANYDIGHVFSTGGGGVAGLGVVCVNNSKARGVTGLPAPIGDAFYIDFVAHEMGHQFDGNHTFNGTLGNCSGSNRNETTAWEPGSGSTIMAYAGICAGDDLQRNSDAHFHSGSFTEIATYTQFGSGCAIVTSTGNTPPSIIMPAGGFTIPIRTPFQLKGTATDVENPNSLTYCWEEFDLGPAGSPNAPTGNAPIFRSFKPDTVPTRVFPKLTDIINNTQTFGELLPTYTRSLSFRFTVRDNNAGAGGVNYESMQFNVTASSGPFIVTQPNTNVIWNSNVAQTVTWNVANTNAAPVNCQFVNIKLSTDGGYSYPNTLASNTANDGSAVVTLPSISSTIARIKIEAVGNVFFDISNTNFTIQRNSIPIIVHTALSDQPKQSWPSIVTANIIDNSGIDSAWVVWYKNLPSNTKRFKLVNTSGDIYSAAFNSLNSDVTAGDSIRYKIFAQSSAVTHDRDSTPLYGFKIINVVLCEGFASVMFPPAGWNVEFTGINYWSRNGVSSYGVGSGSASFEFWDAPVATIQSLVTFAFSATSPGDSLEFDNSYAPYPNRVDSLIIMTSTNGGANYGTLVSLFGAVVTGTLNTVPISTGEFTPTSTQWATKKYALPVGTNKIKFKAISGFGNNLYLDEICVVNGAVPVASNITLIQEGFYDPTQNKLNIRDTVKFYLRDVSPPFNVVDSGKAVVDSSTFTASVLFSSAPTGTYYVQVNHRNTIETWSKSGGESYVRGSVFNYNFTSAETQAFGNNMLQVDASPVRYAIYSGDVNQDGIIDITDGSVIDNNAFNFVTGYVPSDLNGDNFVDITDYTFADNNTFNFVIKVTP
ncbi:MAG: M12 family metallo-peptidase [Bacteroidota bacterium]|nr:M12 family metallo-peptidase [Bacteroidota bacterium]